MCEINSYFTEKTVNDMQENILLIAVRTVRNTYEYILRFNFVYEQSQFPQFPQNHTWNFTEIRIIITLIISLLSNIKKITLCLLKLGKVFCNFRSLAFCNYIWQCQMEIMQNTRFMMSTNLNKIRNICVT